MITGQATISITMSVPFSPERLICTVLTGTLRIVIIRINHNTKKNPNTNPNHNNNPSNNIVSIFRSNSVNNLFYDGIPTIGSLWGFFMAVLWVLAIATGSSKVPLEISVR